MCTKKVCSSHLCALRLHGLFTYSRFSNGAPINMYYMLLTKGLKICQREKERLAFREGTIPCAERTRARHGSLRPTHSVLGRDPETEPLMRPHSSLEAELRCQPGSWVLSHCAPSNQMPGRLSRSCHKALDPKKWWRVLFGGTREREARS